MAKKSINTFSQTHNLFQSLSLNQIIKTAMNNNNRNMNMNIVLNKNKTIVLNKIITRSPQMDPIIWSKLPPEILEYILSFLPLKTFFKLRSTCKGFWSLIFSPSFITKHSSTSPFSSFLLLSHPQFHRHFPLYDCTLAAWRNISLSLSDSLHYNSSSSPTFTTSLVSSGGLFCISDSSSCSLHVYNLLSKLSRKIEYPSFVSHIEHLTFVTTPNGYTIFVLCSQSQSPSSSSSDSAFVFYSNMLSWTKFKSFDPILRDNHHQQGVFHKGGLFFATPEPFSVVRFDLKSGKWERNIDELPNQVTFIRLVSDGKGKLYLIGGVGNNGISRSIKMWEMSEEWNWVEVEIIPSFPIYFLPSLLFYPSPSLSLITIHHIPLDADG